MREVWIRGAAMTRFGRHPDRGARDLVEEALEGALRDAEIETHDVQAVYVGNAVEGLMNGQESVRAQVVLRRTGLSGVPMVNVENACASSSTALHLGWLAVASGMRDRVVVIGYEKMSHEDPFRAIRALNASMDREVLAELFGPAGRERSVFMDLYGAASDGSGRDLYQGRLLAEVAVKNHYHASLNPRAHRQRTTTVEEVLGARPVAGPLTGPMCAPLCDGAACLVLGAPELGRGRREGVRIAASVMTSGRGDDLRRASAVQRASGEAYELAGAGPGDLDVAELHDATAVSELLMYEETGICPPGEAARLVADRTTWLGGSLPVNPSGGMIARGHPMGATGAAQVVELCWQLLGRCGRRQVAGARLAMAQSAGGWVGTDTAACVVHVLQT